MISPGFSDGPSWIVMMPMVSTPSWPSASSGSGASGLAAPTMRTAWVPTADKEGMRVLEVVARRDPAKRLARLERLAGAGIDVADLALRDGDEPHLVDAILPSPQAEVQATAQQVGLVAGLPVEGD